MTVSFYVCVFYPGKFIYRVLIVVLEVYRHLFEVGHSLDNDLLVQCLSL